MDYEKILLEKNLHVTDLSKSLQKKIESFVAISESLKKESEDTSEWNYDDKLNFKEAQENLSKIEEEIIGAINKFDLVAYNKRKADMEAMRNKKKEKNSALKENKEQVQEEGKQPEIQSQSTPVIEMKKREEEIDKNKPEVPAIVVEMKKETTPLPNDNVVKKDIIEEHKEESRKRAEQSSINAKQAYDDLKQQSLGYKKEDEIKIEEVDEFAKAGNDKPKKNTKGFILLGIGIFIATWGAVNIIKDK